MGYSISKISIPKVYSDLYNFFANNSDEAESFMRYIYCIIVKDGDYVIDVGANHGVHTIPLSKVVGETGKVLACEAVSVNIDDIKSKLEYNNVDFFCAAFTKPDVAKNKKQISFTYFPDSDQGSGIRRRPDAGINEKEEIITVPTATLDQIVFNQSNNENINISFVKIDVEGGDFDVLLGAEKILRTYKPVVILENGRQFSADLYNYSSDDFFDYFMGLGYQLFSFTGGIFTKNDWSKNNIYWETWLVHNESKYLNFFHHNYYNFANIFMNSRCGEIL
jgi:FkbM family methyltransferase